jgi:hypothetical protein
MNRYHSDSRGHHPRDISASSPGRVRAGPNRSRRLEQQRRDEQRRYRAWQRNGERIAPVAYDSDTIGKLIKLGYLAESAVGDRCEIGRARRIMHHTGLPRPHDLGSREREEV